MNNHTPGPWKRDSVGFGVKAADGSGYVANCTFRSGINGNRETCANADAIAALPEVLEALAEFIDGIEWNERLSRWMLRTSLPAGTLTAARATVAKAKGQEVTK